MSNTSYKRGLSPHRILHSMLRVADLAMSEDFYCQALGMTVQRKQDYPDGQFTLVFLGYGNEANSTVLELTHNWSQKTYARGDAYGHLALAVTDVYAACEHLATLDVEISRPPGPMKADPAEIIAFIVDPDGYQIELIQRA
ncbi:MAG: lactoylglutathione lyase [Halioglobus sp.]|jgi:lactoylglutathione lyase